VIKILTLYIQGKCDSNRLRTGDLQCCHREEFVDAGGGI
jgi:hypothetical protein